MALRIKSVNTGVIRKGDSFVALAFKIKEQKDKESLYFFPALPLRDLLIALESRLAALHMRQGNELKKYEKARDKTGKKMLEDIPALQEEELRHADISFRVDELELTHNGEDELTITLKLHNGKSVELTINELQIDLLVKAIIHAINNAGMRELALRISSLLDFLPLYDADCQEKDNLEYDFYNQPQWKHDLFSHYLAVLYRFNDKDGKECFSGSIVKTRTPSGSKEAQAISRRLLDFSPRLKKLTGTPCQVYVRTLSANKGQQLSQEQCLRALHHLHVQSVK
ncbi:YjeJ family protein [Pseudocitrobacter cyperus]|uniref:YjeJ family protein n=1 Tax=Pseudocitrobacter cyperus TaxID=3112843 RepID=A0ABV0HPN0_9ENTR